MRCFSTFPYRYDSGDTWLALRMPHKFVNDNGINGFLSTQHEPKSYVVKSPESAQYGLWPRWFM